MKDKSKNGNGWIKAIIMLLVGIVVGLGAYYGYDNYLSKDTKVDKEEKSESLEINADVQKKLRNFVLTGLHFDNMGNSTYEYFLKGTTNLTKEIKLKMAFNNTPYDYDPGVTLSAADVKKYMQDESDSSEKVGIMQKKDFDKSYKELFNEDGDYTTDDVGGCPMPVYDKTKDVFYLFNRCGGTGEDEYVSEVEYYDSDADKYYVHSITTWNDLSEKHRPSEDTKLLWTFDKDLKFVSTEKE